MKRSRYPLKCWMHVDRPTQVTNLPPFTRIAGVGSWTNSDILDHYEIQPDIEDAIENCPTFDSLDAPYRGLAVDISDHGNVELVMCFKNGNTRSIWGAV